MQSAFIKQLNAVALQNLVYGIGAACAHYRIGLACLRCDKRARIFDFHTVPLKQIKGIGESTGGVGKMAKALALFT